MISMGLAALLSALIIIDLSLFFLIIDRVKEDLK